MIANRAGGRRALALVALLAAAGCFEHSVHVGGGAPRGPVVYDRWENFWLGGLIGHVSVDLDRLCPSGRATVEAKQTFLNGLVSGLTSGIYTPTTVRVRCGDGRRAALELSADDVERLAGDPTFREVIAVEMPERLAEVVAAQAATP